MSLHVPKNYQEVKEVLASLPICRVVGTETGAAWLPESSVDRISTSALNCVVDFRPDDLVVTVQSGVTTAYLQLQLKETGLCLPLAPELTGWLSPAHGTVGGLLALGLPYANEAKFGQIRDWVTGMKLMLGNGQIVTVGAQVVKSVAGYDLHRAMVGSRGSLAIILEATLRLKSVSSVTNPDIYDSGEEFDTCWIHKFPQSRFEELANKAHGALAGECQSGLLWAKSLATDLGGGWAIGPRGERRPRPHGIPADWERNLKHVMDPDNRLEEGWI